MQKRWWVYIITNHTDAVLYTGITNDLDRRVFEHKNGLIKNSFSKRYKLYKLVWFQEFNSPAEAIAAEKKVKGWTREKKIALIEQDNANRADLANQGGKNE
ncbi:MAG: GIY-YIG nuclease family protein [Patescibacteria group bacterium]